MKLICILLATSLFYGIAAASMEELRPYTIRVIMWDADGNREADVPATFAYAGQIETLYSAEDGTVSFSLLNFGDMPNGVHINVSCKYGAKDVPVNYAYGATGVTFNEPSESIAIEAFAALGFAAIAIGSGRYLLRRKKNTVHKGDIMDEETNKTTDTKSKLAKDFGVRALIATVAMLGYIGISGIAVYRGDMSMLEDISKTFMPVIGMIIVFYFNGSSVRDASK